MLRSERKQTISEVWTAILTMEPVRSSFVTRDLFQKVLFLIEICKASKHTLKCFLFIRKNVGALLLGHATVAVAHLCNVQKRTLRLS